MKKLVLASMMALASICLVSAPTLRAQDSGQLTIQNPAEFNAYQTASTQTDPAAKATALESFLTAYPQSVAKKAALDELIDAYQGMADADHALSAASRLLQLDPNNMKAVYLSVFIKRGQCLKASDPQTCDDAAALAKKGLTVPKAAGVTDADWTKLTGATYPIYHSAIALDDLTSKQDFKGAISEYRTELMLYPLPATTSGPGLVDTLQLAEAYAKPGDSRDMVQAVWFYARAWNFAPPAYKTQIEPKLEYWYKRYHGGIDGLDAVKTASAATLFKPDTFTVAPAPTPPEIVHNVLASTPDLTKLNLEDKEFILANGNPADAQKLWAVLQNQPTPVPGVVIDASATVLKIAATVGAVVKPRDYVVKLTTPAACGAVPPAPSELKVKDAQAYILANGLKADTDALGDVLTGDPAHIKKLSVEPAVAAIKVAVTQDSKDNKTPDFVVNLKEPVACKEAPAAGFEYKLQPADELDATYDTYSAIPATATRVATAQIVLRDGFIQAEKKSAPVHHPAKPAAAHRPAH
jgi:tetratricopeptide (TPR) repeat protein